MDAAAVPLRPAVRGACEILGLDPLYVASEGRLVAVVPAENAAKVLAAMRAHPLGQDAALIGDVVDEHSGVVVLHSSSGRRILPPLAGEELPRIR